jgi:hypothetical protein
LHIRANAAALTREIRGGATSEGSGGFAGDGCGEQGAVKTAFAEIDVGIDTGGTGVRNLILLVAQSINGL